MRKFVVLFASFAACGQQDSYDPDATNSYIKAGSPAKDYPASCLIDMYRTASPTPSSTPDFVCSGALVAPSLVLTAGHCTSGFAAFRVTCPYLHQTSWGMGVPHPNYHEGPGGALAMDADDVGVVRLQSRIVMDTYPVVRARRVQDGTQVVAVGRVLDGVPSAKELYRSLPVSLMDATRKLGYGHDYGASGESIQPGDSGGPVYLLGASPPEVVAVNSGSGSEFAVFSRLDLIMPWLLTQVSAAGGWALPPGYQVVTPRGPDPTVPPS